MDVNYEPWLAMCDRCDRYLTDAACTCPSGDFRLVLVAALTERDKARQQVAEEIAQALEQVDPVEWALAGQDAGLDAARIAREIGGKA